MKLNLLLLSFFVILFTACSVKPLSPVQFEKSKKIISYEKQIKPILDKRCVSCHSCYNSPCQLKLSSYEGLQRGASKEDIYANRLNASDPTRLFIDAKTNEQWRNKGFFSVTKNLEDKNESIMMQYLYQKIKNPKLFGKYNPETDKKTCAKSSDELNEYFEDNAHKGMPYGFPTLKKDEYNLLMNYFSQDISNNTKTIFIPKEEKLLIKKLEDFLNTKNLKYEISARYIYEHLFLAHISLKDDSSNFYELVRSRTKTGNVDIIATRFPYSKIEGEFYYRLRKISSTIVHKTHMVYKINEKRIQRYKELFIETKWDEKPYKIPYNKKISANALRVFEQIPAKSRYEFLLDDIHYIIMTFIRGTVCKGQIALNVIQDHFWVMFLDPKYDLSLKNRYFLHDNLSNLDIPNQFGDDPSILKTFSILDNYSMAKKFNENRSKLYSRYYPKGIGYESIWKGNKKNQNKDSILTIYRHFDSASVHQGALGDIPKTLWVIDYPLLERIYYSLVAGFDVFGNTAHQLLVRKHMDRLRIEGESNFLNYLPKKSRKNYFNSWYQGWVAQQLAVYNENELNSKIEYKTLSYKNEFVKRALKILNQKPDSINFIESSIFKVDYKKEFKTKKEIEEGFKSLIYNSKLIKYFTDNQSNLSYLRIKMKNKKDLIYTLVTNRWHKNIALMFDEESRINHKRDSLHFIEGFIGSYPNAFLEVKQEDLGDFFNIFKNYNNTLAHKKTILKFVINRANKNFWSKYDWYDKKFKEQDPLNYGIFDLNRYWSEVYY